MVHMTGRGWSNLEDDGRAIAKDQKLMAMSCSKSQTNKN